MSGFTKAQRLEMSEKPTNGPARSAAMTPTDARATTHGLRLSNGNKRLNNQMTADHTRFSRSTTQNWVRFAFDRISAIFLMFSMRWASLRIFPAAIRANLWPDDIWLCLEKSPPAAHYPCICTINIVLKTIGPDLATANDSCGASLRVVATS